MKDSTELIQFKGNFNQVNDKAVEMLNPPIYSGSTVVFDNYEDLSMANAGKYQGVCYGTDRLPTQRAFEEALNCLEGSTLTRAFQSGINAIQHALMAFTRAGDHILVVDNVYGPTARFCSKILSRYHIETTYVPSNIGADIENFIRSNTRLIFLESPGSNTFEIQDIPAITKLARSKDIITMLDNTWATPIYLKPLELDVDISIQSVTKYISGHSDLLMGAVSVNSIYAEQFDEYYRTMEIYASAHDSYLALRGLKTLGVRLKQHQQSALTIAQWLQTQDHVAQVIHPALAEHPQHSLWQRDFKGASGLFAFTLRAEITEQQIGQFIDSLQLFAVGYSWGGFKSLITAGKYRRNTASHYADTIIIRLNIGLEDYDDLITDLKQGFSLFKP